MEKLESPESYEQKIERAKKLYSLFNDISFGNKIDAIKSRIVIKQVL